MVITMVSLTRTKTGRWAARKAIPADVRDAYGKREEKKTWPASLAVGQAKAELAAWLTPIEERIELLRGVATQEAVTLSKRQRVALAGVWYKRQKAKFEDDPESAASSADWQSAVDELEPTGPEDEAEPALSIPDWLSDELDELLTDKALKVTPETKRELAQEMARLWYSLCLLMVRRAGGDYGPDNLADTLPAFDRGASPEKGAVSILGLFEDYAKTGTAVEHTIRKWRRAITSFVEHLGHDDATKATRSDAHAWFDSLIAGGLSVRTVQVTYRAALARVFKVAYDRGRLAKNPMERLEVFGPKATQSRRKDLTDTEAKTILRASLGSQPERLSDAHARARRWVPWICAYTGARVNEITQLRAMDIRQVDGVWVFHITPEAGSVKTRKARSVPIHSHLLEQGITDLAEEGSEVPLFYDPKAVRKGSVSHPLHTQMGSKLAKWVRSLGVTEVQSPNHGWRHRFKTLARRVGMDPEARDAIQGHAPKTEGQAYGEWPMDALRAEVEKLPTYTLI